MVFLRKFTLVVSEIILLLLVTVLLIRPDWMADWVAYITQFSISLRVVIVILFDLIIFFAVISQLRGGENYRGKALLIQSGDSKATVTAESMRQRLKRAISSLDDIESVETAVDSQKGMALVSIEVVTSKDEINIPNKQREIDRTIKLVVVKQMGVKLAQPATVNIRLASDTGDDGVQDVPTPEVASVPVVREAPEVKTDTLPPEPDRVQSNV